MDNSQIENTINEIRKRNGTVTAFDLDKISNAIYQALAATSKADRGAADKLAGDVLNKLVEQGFTSEKSPTVEDIQDIVESTLIDSGNSDIAKSYIVYRHERRKLRDEKMRVLNLKSLDTVSKKFDGLLEFYCRRQGSPPKSPSPRMNTDICVLSRGFPVARRLTRRNWFSGMARSLMFPGVSVLGFSARTHTMTSAFRALRRA